MENTNNKDKKEIKDEILYKNKTRYTKDAYTKFLEFHQKKFGLKNKLYTLYVLLVLAFLIVINIKYTNYLNIVFIGLIAVLFLGFKIFYPERKIKKEYNSEKFTKEIEFTFIFYDKYMHISNGKESQKVKYKKLYKIYETDSYFYIYLNDNLAFSLKKDNFSIGKEEEFFKFMKKKIGIKINL